MRLFGLDIKRSKKADNFSTSSQLRPSFGQGAFTSYFNSWVPRNIDPAFYEILREAIPLIDAAIWKLVALEGHIIVEGNNEKLIEEIKDWIDNIKVNDMQKGLQAFHQNITNETFEQGFGLGEFIADKKRSDIVQLKIADSKTIKFARKGDSMDIFQKADGDQDYRQLKPANLIYFSINNENQNPYGTSIMRSMEFVSKILATMHNSLLNVWERFGDPSYAIIYKTSKRSIGEGLEARRTKIATDFDAAMRKKREGQSMDYVAALDKDSDISIEVIGPDGQVLELEVPARHVEEQIISKTGLPAWMLGMHWSTTERLADKEVTMLLQDIETRHAAKLPAFTRLIAILLLLRGRTWKQGDWSLKFKTANLHDIEKQARARFLNAQADMYYLNAGLTLDEIPKSADTEVLRVKKKSTKRGCGSGKEQHLSIANRQLSILKELHRPFDWPELDKTEDDYEKELQYEWRELQNRVLSILGFDAEPNDLQKPDRSERKQEGFTYSDEQRAAIMDALKGWLGPFDPSDPDSAVKWYYGLSYSLGLIQAALMVGDEQPILNILKNKEILDDLYKNGFKLIKNRATINIIEKILPELDAQVLAGVNSSSIARRLKELFGNANADWERLARSELAMAAERAKLNEWKARKIKMIEFVPAPDACPICKALKGDYPIGKVPLPVADTHPRCRCATRPAKEGNA